MKYIQHPARSQHALRFVAGLFGVVQGAATGTLTPEFGWAVIEEHQDGSHRT